LLNELKKYNVTIISNSPVIDAIPEREIISAIKLKNNTFIKGKSFILATGGKSHPETGSTGDGFTWLKKLGHTVHEPSASLVPIVIKDAWVKRLQGVTLQEAKITVLQNNTKQSISKGKILFTHFGISGPTVLNMSSEISELLKYGEVYISLDLVSQYDHGQLNTKLQDIFKENSNKKLKNSLDTFLPSALIPVVIENSGVDENTPAHSITRENRLTLIETLKNMKMEVEGLLGEDKAIITSGGVSLEEVDFKTMASKKYPNLFLVGDILDIDRPSGGYSLQLCWTTGFVAGSNA
jgi:predicted Rossmann fold flavoprotein